MKKRAFIWFTLLIMGLVLLLAACGDSSTIVSSSGTSSESSSVDSSATKPSNNPAFTTAAATTAAASTTAASNNGSGAATTAASNYPTSQATPLKAGSVDDNLKFDDYLQYMQSYQGGPVLRFDVSERYIINVVDSNSRSVANSLIKIYSNQQLIFEGKTYSNGQILFFPRAIPAAGQARQFEVVAEKNGQKVSKTFSRQEQGQRSSTWLLEFKISLRPQLAETPKLDLLFLLDSTGSMGGEIRRIQQTINEIANQISGMPGNPKVRYGVVTYRDRGDSYITRKFGFTENLSEFSSFLNSIQADGGDDYPESLNAGLHVAISEMNWNNADGVRLTFLVADAPPHLDYQDDYSYITEIVNAGKKGIKVYSIGASGLDKPGEYVFRQLSQITLAQFLFITRGGDEANPASGGPASNTGVVYEEKQLDKLVVNIVLREITNLAQ